MLERNELAHYGVLGMKWGVRKDRSSSGSGKPSSKKKVSISGSIKAASKSAADKAKQAKEDRAQKKAQARKEKIMSNPLLLQKHKSEFTESEVKQAISRIQMDKQIRDLSIDHISRGKKYADSIVGYGKTASDIYNLINSPLGQQIRKKMRSS